MSPLIGQPGWTIFGRVAKPLVYEDGRIVLSNPDGGTITLAADGTITVGPVREEPISAPQQEWIQDWIQD